jgi:hypothetical protein
LLLALSSSCSFRAGFSRAAFSRSRWASFFFASSAALPEPAFESGTVLVGHGPTEAAKPRRLAEARAGRFFAAAEAPAFATFLPDVAWREGGRCVVFLRFGFLASAAIQISPRRMLGALVHRTPPGNASYPAKTA